mmetsp:Transcript_17402/g.49387  ORF Transcript_17402/g.49387 Transcript_17402/m.49387 type:complete len:210 (+) Transcript_17402:664-1293(+)
MYRRIALFDGRLVFHDGRILLEVGVGQFLGGLAMLSDGRLVVLDGGVLLLDGVGQFLGGPPLLIDDAVLLTDGAILLEDGTIPLPESHRRVVQFCKGLEVFGLPWTDRHDEGHLGVPHRGRPAHFHLGQNRHHRAVLTEALQLQLEIAKQKLRRLVYCGLRFDVKHANPRLSVVVAHDLHDRLASCIVGLQQSGAVLNTALRNGMLDSL